MMRTLRYLVTIDESFAERDYGRTKRFLNDVVEIVPAGDVGCIVRRTSPVPVVSTTADGMLTSPTGRTIVTKYRQLNCTEVITKNANQRDTTWSEVSGMRVPFDDMWRQFCRRLNHLSLDRSGEGYAWDRMTNE